MVKVQQQSSARGFPAHPASFVEMTGLSLLNGLGLLSKSTGIYLLGFVSGISILLNWFMSSLRLILLYPFDSWRFVVRFEVEKCGSSNFVLSFWLQLHFLDRTLGVRSNSTL